MGIDNHNAVLATTWEHKVKVKIRAWIAAQSEWSALFVEADGFANSYTTFIMVPDGSKEGWDLSNAGDKVRASFIEMLKTFDSVKIVEVGYGEYGAAILKTNCKNCYNDRPYVGAL